MDCIVDNDLLADVAALLTAIDAVEPPSGPIVPHLCDDAGTLSKAPLVFTGGDEWPLLNDVFGLPDKRDTPSPVITRDRTGSKPTSTARVKTSRERQKAEREYLQKHATELDKQLRDLKKAQLACATDQERPSDQLAVSDAVAAFWRRQAESERQARERSVVENARLRQSLDAQVKMMKALARVLHKQPSGHHSLLSSSAARQEATGDAEIYEFLMQNLDERYAQIDAVWRESGLATCSALHQDARHVDATRSNSPIPWYLEFVDSKIVPFEFALVCDATWRALQTPTVSLSDGVYEVVEVLNDLIKAEFRLQMLVDDMPLLGRARFVARRYLEEGRQALVWALWSTAEGGLIGKGHSIRLVEEGWGMVSPLANDGDANAQLSLVQTCGRMRPNMAIPKNSPLEAQIGLLAETLLATYHDILRGMDDHMGRMMMEAAAQ